VEEAFTIYSEGNDNIGALVLPVNYTSLEQAANKNQLLNSNGKICSYLNN